MNWERADPPPGNPLTWSVPLVRAAGIGFRLHFVFLAYALVVVLRGAFGPAESFSAHGLWTVTQVVLALLVNVFLREAVRAFVVRAAGGAADDVQLWPLGSLQGIEPAPGWLAALLSASIGTAASALFLAANGVLLGVVTGDWWGAALPDPFSAAWLLNPHARWVDALWIIQWTGIQLSLLSLLPMLPLDGGRAVEAFVLRSRGAFDAPRIAAGATLAASAAVGIVGIVRDLPTLLSVAIACAGYAAFLLWRLRAGDAVAQATHPWTSAAAEAADEERAERDRRARERAAAEAEDRAVDAVLEKINREGADRLTAAERSILAKATERRRRQGGR